MSLGSVLLTLLTLWVEALVGWFLLKGLRTGSLETRFGQFDRAKQPRAFWAGVVTFASLMTGIVIITGVTLFFGMTN
jgi:hypothetical protein